MDQYDVSGNSAQWNFFVKISFGLAIAATAIGILLLPGDLVVKGYFSICSLFLVFATITMSKTLRDEHESKRLHNKISEARTTRIINELDGKGV